MRRGEIYLANLEPTQNSEQVGTRPVIIVSRDAINNNSSIVVVVPVTKFQTRKTIYPSQILLKKNNANNLATDSIALGEQIRAIAKSRLLKKTGQLDDSELNLLDAALRITLSL